MKNNKGFSVILIIALISLVFIALFVAYSIFYKQENISLVTPKQTVKYTSVGRFKFILPSNDISKVDEFLKNEANKKCFIKDYFSENAVGSGNDSQYVISLYNLPENPLCDKSSDSYPEIILNSGTKFSGNFYNDKDLYSWELIPELSNSKFDVFYNKFQAKTKGKDYFLVSLKENTVNNEVLISINPAPSYENLESSLEYNYIKKLIKNFEIVEQSEFKGLSNCKQEECKNMQVIPSLKSVESHKNNPAFTIRTYRVVLKDSFSTNEYFKDIPESSIFNNEIFINKISKMGDKVIFDYIVTDVTNLNNTKSISKISSLDLKTGVMRDLVVNPTNLPIQSFIIDGDFIYYAIGETCIGKAVLYETTQKIIYRYDFRSNKIIQLTDKTLTNYNIFKNSKVKEKEVFIDLLKVENNQLLLKYYYNDGYLRYNNYYYYNMTTNEFTPLKDGLNITSEDENTFEEKIQVKKYFQLLIKDEFLIEK